jgi:predicted Zn-dependent protease
MPITLPPGTASYSDRSPPPKNRQLLLLLAIIVGVIVGVIWFLDNLILFIPPSVERQLGALMVPTFERLAKPSATQDTLNQLLDRLEVHLPDKQRQGRDYQVLYVPDATINAVAIPGDRIIIYQGLLAQAKSENELMMVLGHELGHFAHRDHLRALGRGIGIQLALSTILGDLSALQSLAVSGLTTLSDARFSQQQEYDADNFGLEILQATYQHVAGATDFFDRMSRQEGIDIAFLATHPAAKERVKRLQSVIASRRYAVRARSALPEALRVQE